MFESVFYVVKNIFQLVKEVTLFMRKIHLQEKYQMFLWKLIIIVGLMLSTKKFIKKNTLALKLIIKILMRSNIL